MGTKVSEAEFILVEERALAAGLTLSEWVRDVVLAELETNRPGIKPNPDAGTEVVLAEVLALRSLFLNLQFRTGREELTESELRGLIERADATKSDRARERLRAASAAAPEAQPEEVADDGGMGS